MTKPTKKSTWKPNLGTFSKALEGAVSLNFSENGSTSCSDTCKLKSGRCYGLAVEKMKPSVKVSGERKREAGFLACVKEYKKQLSKKSALPWIRFSSFGSVPNRPLSAEESTAFQDLIVHASHLGPVHFPVETQAKRERFQQLAPAGVLVRESAGSIGRLRNLAKNGTASSGVWMDGETKRERLEKAQQWAKKARKQGVPVAVCPAIASTIEKRKDVKCGDCTLCAKFCGGIIYPQH